MSFSGVLVGLFEGIGEEPGIHEKGKHQIFCRAFLVAGEVKNSSHGFHFNIICQKGLVRQ
jgi:hypothetical protein